MMFTSKHKQRVINMKTYRMHIMCDDEIFETFNDMRDATSRVLSIIRDMIDDDVRDMYKNSDDFTQSITYRFVDDKRFVDDMIFVVRVNRKIIARVARC